MAFLSSLSWSHWSLPSDDHLEFALPSMAWSGPFPDWEAEALISIISEPSSLERERQSRERKRVDFRNILGIGNVSGHGGIGFLEPPGQFLVETLGDFGAFLREVSFFAQVILQVIEFEGTVFVIADHFPFSFPYRPGQAVAHVPGVVGEMEINCFAGEFSRLPEKGQEALPIDRFATPFQPGQLEECGVKIHAGHGYFAKLSRRLSLIHISEPTRPY